MMINMFWTNNKILPVYMYLLQYFTLKADRHFKTLKIKHTFQLKLVETA